MISENNMALLEKKCIDIANAFFDNWAAVGKAVDKMLTEAKVPWMFRHSMKFGVQPKENDYKVKYYSHGYCFAFTYDCNIPNRFALLVLWNECWSRISGCSGPDEWSLGIDNNSSSIEKGIKTKLSRLAETKALDLINWKLSHDSSIFDELAKGAIDATNNFIRLTTDAYNKALDLEHDNDNTLMSAFELVADGPAYVKPKQYDVNIVERKTECASMRI